MVNSDIFRPLPLQACGEAERERLAREAARALRMLHGDSITPSPECLPLLPVETPLGPPAAPKGASAALPAGQQQASAVQQPAAPTPQQMQTAAAAAAAKPAPLADHGGAPAGSAVLIHAR